MTAKVLAAAISALGYDSPIGHLRLVFATDELIGVYLPDQFGYDRFSQLPLTNHCLAEPIRQWLTNYFAGASASVDDLQEALRFRWRLIGTEFQKLVWQQLSYIPFGELQSYRQIAQNIGRPTATRAVGAAIGDNPLSILVPCHRVVSVSGALTGYAGGLKAKHWLLEHERNAIACDLHG